MSVSNSLFGAPLIILFAALAHLSVGCAGSQKTPDTQFATQQEVIKVEPQLPAADLLAAHANWMPEDTIAIMFGAPHALWDMARNAFPVAERGGDTHFEAFQNDISQLFLPHIGMNLREIDAVTLAVGMRWQVLILSGDLAQESLKSHTTHQINGHIVYQFESGILGSSQVFFWGVPLEDQQGMALFLTPEAVEQATVAQSSTEGTLAKTSASFDAFQSLLKTSTSTNLVLAGHLTDADQQTLTSLTSMPAPRMFLLDYGGNALRGQIQGEPEVLNHYEQIFAYIRTDMPTILQSMYSTGGLASAMERVGFLIGYHFALSYGEALKVERTPEILSIDIGLPRKNFLMLLSTGAAIAVPAFEKYILRSKASEASFIISQLKDRAIAHYEQFSEQGICTFPPSANPVPAEEPCCDRVGPSDGQRWQAPAQTWEQLGWKALNYHGADSTYFAYQTVLQPGEDGGPDTFILRAFADFKPGGTRHTTEQHIIGHQSLDGTCHTQILPPVTYNEFE